MFLASDNDIAGSDHHHQSFFDLSGARKGIWLDPCVMDDVRGFCFFFLFFFQYQGAWKQGKGCNGIKEIALHSTVVRGVPQKRLHHQTPPDLLLIQVMNRKHTHVTAPSPLQS